MASVHINIVNPNTIYNDLNVDNQYRLSEIEFMNTLKAELKSALSAHGVKEITISIHKNMELYSISLNNIKNDWQEEKIREECDITYISFIKKENLISLK